MFGGNLKYLRAKHNMEQLELAHQLGRKSSSSVSEWEKGKYTPKMKVLVQIAELFKVDLDDLMNKDLSIIENSNNITYVYNQLNSDRKEKVYNFAEDQLEEQNKVVDLSDYRTVAIQSRLSAGTGIVDLDPEYIDEVETKEYVPKHDLAFLVDGDSMEPLFEHNEIVFVEKTPDIHNGQVIAVQINDEAYIKKVYKENDCLRLVSLNKEYDDIYANKDDDIRIVGKVII